MTRKQILATFILMAGLLLAAMTASSRASATSRLLDGQAQSPSRLHASTQTDLGSGFTHQGFVQLNGSPVDDTCDFTFSLFDAASAGNQIGATETELNVVVSQGRFTVLLNEAAQFGPDAFTGQARWLETAVRCPAGGGNYTTLSPRQELTAVPYALSLQPGATISGTVPFEGVLNLNSGGTGLAVHSAGGSGVFVESAGGSGVWVNSAGRHGLHVSRSGDDGVFVNSAGSPWRLIPDEGTNGFEVAGVEGNGLYVGRADQDGVYVYEAGLVGVHVGEVGNPSGSIAPFTPHHGFIVEGASGHGLFVGRADALGVYVYEAGLDGVYVVSAGESGVLVNSAGSHGFSVNQTVGHGVYVDEAGDDGFRVYTAVDDGFHVESAGNDGVYVQAAGHIGVSAIGNNLAGAFYGDVQINGSCIGCALATFGINSSQQPLQPGAIVTLQSSQPAEVDGVPLLLEVGPAQSGQIIVGVVQGRAELVTEENPRPDESGQLLVPREGAAAPGDYVTIIIHGITQVQASALDAPPIASGERLAVSAAGAARPLQTVQVATLDGGATSIVENAPTLGIALESLAAGEEGLIWVLVNPH